MHFAKRTLIAAMIVAGAGFASHTYAQVSDEEIWQQFTDWLVSAPQFDGPREMYNKYRAGLIAKGASAAGADRQMDIIERLMRERPDAYGAMFNNIYRTDNPVFSTQPNALLVATIEQRKPGRALDIGHRVLPLGRIFSGKVPGLEVQGNHQARFAFPTFGPTALVSPIVGMAQGALDAFAETARGARRMARPGVFEKVAESHAYSKFGRSGCGAHRCRADPYADKPAGRARGRAGRRDARDRTTRAHPPQPRLCCEDFDRGCQRHLLQIRCICR